MMNVEQMLGEIYKPSWFIYSEPKTKKNQTLVDNYAKTAHILNISYNYHAGDYQGYCSLCGHSLSTKSARCPFCRASIEEDCW